MADLRTSTIVPTEEIGVATFSLEEQQPKEKTSWISIIVSVIAILLLGVVAYYLLFSNGKKGKKGKGTKGNKYATPGTLQAPGSRPNGSVVGDGKKDKNGGKGSKAPQRPPVDRPRPQPPVTTDPITDTDDAQIQPVPDTDTGTSFNIVTSADTSVDDTITTADDTETNFTVTTDDDFETTVSVGDDVPFGRGSGDPVAIFRG